MKTDCTKINTDEAIIKLKQALSVQRFAHSLVTAEKAQKIAEKYGLNGEKAYLAGLFHDCAKCFEYEKLRAIGEKMGLEESELNNRKVLHAPVSAYVAKYEYGIDDEEIFSAIRWHTLGTLGMSDFDKVIFLADKVEPLTRESSHIGLIEKSLEISLDEGMLQSYRQTIVSLAERRLPVCVRTIDVYNDFLSKCDARKVYA